MQNFNNHKNGDFKLRISKSKDKGKSWKSISSNLPVRGTVYDIAEDHVDLIFFLWVPSLVYFL